MEYQRREPTLNLKSDRLVDVQIEVLNGMISQSADSTAEEMEHLIIFF